MFNQLTYFPPLRNDIETFQGPKTNGGAPTWNIYDPVRNQFFKIGWLEYEIIQRNHIQKPELIAYDICQNTTLITNPEQVLAFVNFLEKSNLLETTDKEQVGKLLDQKKSLEKKDPKSFLYRYFYIKIRLLRPDNFLNKTIQFVRPLFSKFFLYILIFCGLLGLYLVSRQWYEFRDTFQYYFNLKSLIYYIPALIFAKIMHEFGHAYAAKNFNCRVPTMGVALLFMWPVFYTDTTDTYRLKSRKKRIIVASAGIMTELCLAVFATLLWNFLPDGPLRAAAFFAAAVSWFLSIAININPFLRFDGYYFLADISGVDNLQPRSFLLAKWKIGEWLFGFGDPPPFFVPKKKHNFMLIYAFSTIIFRLFLYIGISYMVYSRVFKALGIMLMCTAFIKFLVVPVVSELKSYWEKRDKMRFNKNIIISSSVIFSILFLLIYPWKTSLDLSAIIDFEENFKVYTPRSVQIKEINFELGQTVEKESTLVSFNIPKLVYDIHKSRKEIDILKHRIISEKGQTEKFGYKQTSDVELVSKETQFNGLLEELRHLKITAPFSGKVVFIETGIKPGQWLKKDTLIAEIIKPEKRTIRAYISEFDLSKVQVGTKAVFYQENDLDEKINAKVIEIEKVSISELEDEYLASIHKGDVPVSKDENGRLVPSKAFYKVILKPETNHIPETIMRGFIKVEGKPSSLIKRALTKIHSVFIRESGF